MTRVTTFIVSTLTLVMAACGASGRSSPVAANYESLHASADALEDRGEYAAAAASLEPHLTNEELTCSGEHCARLRSDLAARIAENYLAAGNGQRALVFGHQAEEISRPLRDEWRLRALIVSARTFEANAEPARASETYEQAQMLALSLLQRR